MRRARNGYVTADGRGDRPTMRLPSIASPLALNRPPRRGQNPRRGASCGVALAAALLSGCNAYDAFRVTGYAQEGFTNRADILFVVDNSPTMFNESEALATSFAGFIADFAQDPPTEAPSLSNEVDRYIDYLSARTDNLNYHLGITTASAYVDHGNLLGDPRYLTPLDDNVPGKFNQNLICDAACVGGNPSVDVTCPGGIPDSSESCEDGSQLREEPLEAVFLALCAAVDNPPDECFYDWWWDDGIKEWVRTAPGDTGLDNQDPPADYFGTDDVGANAGWLRPGGVVIPVIVTDEGDQSRRVPNREPRVTEYLDLYRRFGSRTAFAVIGPNLGCNDGGAADWGVDRLKAAVNATNGVYVDIAEPDVTGSTCQAVDFSQALGRVGDLLRGLADTFPLRALPEPGTIVVQIDGAPVDEATCTFDEDIGQTVCEDGWAYDAQNNAVVLHGNAVPDFDADVNVYYLPADGVPRDLPF